MAFRSSYKNNKGNITVFYYLSEYNLDVPKVVGTRINIVMYIYIWKLAKSRCVTRCTITTAGNAAGQS